MHVHLFDNPILGKILDLMRDDFHVHLHEALEPLNNMSTETTPPERGGSRKEEVG